MATVYRDYGYMNKTYPVIPSNEFDIVLRKQVYLATHGGDDLRLPFMNRSFISFSFGGKDIESFDLIATTSGDRLNRTGYASFEDNTSSYDNLDGLQYWGTHYKNNSMDFTLSTDGIDLKKLDEFLYWFRPGETRELILAEHPNRVIFARVADPPSLELLPFEGTTNMTIDNSSYLVHTTLYKGNITLRLVMDYPFWHSKENILGIKVDGGARYEDKWVNPNGETVRIVESPDALKILYEDGIPLGSMIQASMLLGNGAYATFNNLAINLIWDPETVTHTTLNGILVPASGTGARIAANDSDRSKGLISGAVITPTENGVETFISGNINPIYFFYAGTAPAPTTIRFTLTPTINSGCYIQVPGNSFVTSHGHKYNTITVEGETSLELRLTTPNIYTSYNTAISRFRESIDINKLEELRGYMRDSLYHPDVRAWAIKVIDFMAAKNSVFNANLRSLFMSKFLYSDDETPVILPVTFTFDSNTGEALGKFLYRKTTDGLPANTDAWASYGTLSGVIEEDVGDMLLSNYIIIRDRNYPRASDGAVINWQSSGDGKRYSHKITHDFEVNLEKFSIFYDNLYL